MDQETKRSELKKLILRGKEQGFLTYREINDHLPEDMHDTDQIEAVVNMINDMGIDVYDHPPDPDTLLMKSESADEEAAEEAEAVLASAVESEFGRTTDPVRMYMREMGTVDLLTRQDEIALARRIESGIRQSMEAMATCPAAVADVVSMTSRIEAGEMRLTDLVAGFIDPYAVNDVRVPKPRTGDEDSEEEDLSPKPEEAAERFKRIRKYADSMVHAVQRYGIGCPQAKKHKAKLAVEFLEIKFVSKQVDFLSERVRTLVEQVRERERIIMRVCVNEAHIPRKEFINGFIGHETDPKWLRLLMKRKAGDKEALRANADVIKAAQARLAQLEQRMGLPLRDIKDVNRRMSIGEAVDLINTEDRRVADAVRDARSEIVAAIEAVVGAFSAGGRLIYLGAGTSGRLGVLDAAECPPTFLSDPNMVVGLIAGGPDALTRSVEGAEDRADDAARKIDRLEVRWPSGRVQSFEDLPGRATIRIVEGADPVVPGAP